MMRACLLTLICVGLQPISDASDYPVYLYNQQFGQFARQRVKRQEGNWFATKPCAVTKPERYSWWRVELPSEALITDINITNPSINLLSKDVEIRVGDEDIARAPRSTHFTKNHECKVLRNTGLVGRLQLLCTQPVVGKYLSVQVVSPCTKATCPLLPLCEIQARGYDLTSLRTGRTISALNKKAKQSSVSVGGVARLAVDGNKQSAFYDTASGPQSCAVVHNRMTDQRPSMVYEVNLGGTYNVKEVRFSLTQQVPNSFIVEADVQYEAVRPVAQGEVRRCGIARNLQQKENVIKCGQSQLGKYVALRLTCTASYCRNLGAFINACDVRVTGHEVPNLALGQFASQSSTTTNGDAALAIDGDTTVLLGFDGQQSSGCARTLHEIEYPWWSLQFHKEHLVDRLLIYNRQDELYTLLHDYEVRVGNTEPNVYSPYPLEENAVCARAGRNQRLAKGPNEVLCHHPLVGRYLTIQIVDKCPVGRCRMTDDVLSLCEVEVYGFPLEFYDTVDAAGRKPLKRQLLLLDHQPQASALKAKFIQDRNSVRDLSQALVSWWEIQFTDVYAVSQVEIFADFPRTSRNRQFLVHAVVGFPAAAANSTAYSGNATCFGPSAVTFGGTYVALKCSGIVVGKKLTLFSAVNCSQGCMRADAQLNIKKLEVQAFKVRQTTSLNEQTVARKRLDWTNRNDLVSVEQLGSARKSRKTTRCAQTVWNDPYPIWYVDLGHRAIVTEVLIVNRIDGTFHRRLHDIEIRVGPAEPPVTGSAVFTGNVLCAQRANQSLPQGPSAVKCTQPVRGRYVSIQIVRKCQSSSCDRVPYNILTLCEVQVTGYEIEINPSRKRNLLSRASKTSQSSTYDNRASNLAVDGRT